MSKGTVVGVNLSTRRGTGKTNVGSGHLIADYGLQGDAHAGTSRQVSLFTVERAGELTAPLGLTFRPGDFAENITVQGLNLKDLRPGIKLFIGEAILEVTQIGKQEAEGSPFSFFGLAPLKTEGVYCRVIKSGRIKEGDRVILSHSPSPV
ncbi:MOSC domain-containing protein [Moorellaceae bacterium AZ2]